MREVNDSRSDLFIVLFESREELSAYIKTLSDNLIYMSSGKLDSFAYSLYKNYYYYAIFEKRAKLVIKHMNSSGVITDVTNQSLSSLSWNLMEEKIAKAFVNGLNIGAYGSIKAKERYIIEKVFQ